MDTPTVTPPPARPDGFVPDEPLLMLPRPWVPAASGHVVPRPRLLAMVDTGLREPLTLVTGPAGTGKTTLAEVWAGTRQERRRVAWLTVEPGHDESGRFWAAVVAALRAQGVVLASRPGPVRDDTAGGAFLDGVAAALRESSDPVVLVLDQLDGVTDDGVLRQLDRPLDAAQPGLRVVATARSEPRVLTWRRRLRGTLTTIQAADLAFTPDETAELLDRHHLDHSVAAVSALQDATEGWAAGLRLCVLGWSEHGETAGPTGGPWAERRLADYLGDEVLGRLPGDRHELLVQLSVVDRMEAGLARALSERPDADRVLRDLAGEDLLVTTGTDPRRWFRVHPLLREALRAELRARGPGAVSRQHRRAAGWYDAHGDHTRAVTHYLAAGRPVEASASVVRHLAVVDVLDRRAPWDLDEVLAPHPRGHEAPEVRVVQAALELAAHRPDRAAEALAEVTGTDLTGPHHGALRATAGLCRIVLAGEQQDAPAAVEAWQELGPTLRTVGPPPVRARVRAHALAALSESLLWSGDLESFERVLDAAVEAAETQGCERARVRVLGQQALGAYRRGALRDAARWAQEAVLLDGGTGDRAGLAHLALSAVSLEWNDLVASRRHLEAADLASRVGDDPVLAAAVTLVRAYHLALDGRRARALSAVADVRATVESRGLPSWLADSVVVTEAMVRLRCGDVPGAVSVLEASPSAEPSWLLARATAAEASGDAAEVLRVVAPVLSGEVPPMGGADVQALLLVAHVRLDQGDLPAARRALVDALRAARPAARRRPFVESRDVLHRIIADDPELARACRWVGRGLTPRRHDEDVVPVLVEPLTSRETSVLGLMAQVMTVADIAEDLHISVNTVKTHQRSLYRKLSVARAHEAVRRGSELELI